MKLDAEAKLRELWATLPKIACQGKCQECCGPIGMTTLEANMMKAIDHRPIGTVNRKTGRCPKLNGSTGKCTVYDARPTICRLWGIVDRMPCTFGCKPERMLTEEEQFAFMQRVKEIAGEESFSIHTMPGMTQLFRELYSKTDPMTDQEKAEAVARMAKALNEVGQGVL